MTESLSFKSSSKTRMDGKRKEISGNKFLNPQLIKWVESGAGLEDVGERGLSYFTPTYDQLGTS
jgi:hypothetical protein